jgi:hypothetical protein
MNVQIELPHPGATVLHIPHGSCADDEFPLIMTYVAGHFATGEPYYARDVWCL